MRLIFAQRLKNEVENYLFETVKQITISIGLAQLRQEENKDEIFKRTDSLLYKSKHDGRNRVSTEEN